MIPFRKMNGLGNDFAIVDARKRPFDLTGERVAELGRRDTGIGFDQFIVIAPAGAAGGDATMRVLNSDGGEVGACGNGARCVAALLIDENGGNEVRIDSRGGMMRAWRSGTGHIAVDMGVPSFEAVDIPLAPGAGDPLALQVEGFSDRFGKAACANVGNPHAVFFVDDPSTVPLEEVGPALEHHRFFPERANISFVKVDGDDAVARVWERGAGATAACGTAACAIGALTHHLGRTGPAVTVHLPGGALHIDVSGGHIVMEGPYALDYVGAIMKDGFVKDPLAPV